MGWLDHSTNNIILDAVLTDYGRQRLAAGGAGFTITHYALADDEVDYRLIKKYGRTVGKEKIEKNTPIFEALTNPSIALKYKLIGRENDGTAISSQDLPILKTSSVPNLTKSVTSFDVTVDLYYRNGTGTAVPQDLVQTMYKIKVSDRFFTVSGKNVTGPSVINSGDPNRIATYTLTTAKSTDTSIKFTIKPRNISNTMLTIYGKRIDSSSSTRQINSYITVIGERHGCTLDIPITYKASLT